MGQVVTRINQGLRGCTDGALEAPLYLGYDMGPMWRDVDKLRTVADTLLDEGIIDAGDYEATFETVLNLAVRWGHVDENAARAHRNASAVSRDEQRRIVEEYVRFAETTNSPVKRSAKIKSLGVCPQTLAGWARRHFGSGCLAKARPIPTARLILDFLAEHPWATRAEILEGTGVVRSSMPGALDWLRRKGRIVRRKNDRGLYEYSCPLQ